MFRNFIFLIFSIPLTNTILCCLFDKISVNRVSSVGGQTKIYNYNYQHINYFDNYKNSDNKHKGNNFWHAHTKVVEPALRTVESGFCTSTLLTLDCL